MIFDFYEQADLLRIAKCRWQSKLIDWLEAHHIPFGYDAHGRVIAHKKAVEAGFGVEAGSNDESREVSLWLGDEDVA